MTAIIDTKSNSLRDFFNTHVESLSKYKDYIKSYIINVLAQPQIKQYDLLHNSITVIYANANFAPNFQKFQQLGDWLLVSKCLFPGSLSRATPEYYDTIAQNCYYKCYLLINKKWPIFKDLAEIFPQVVVDLQQHFLNSTKDPNFLNLANRRS